MKIAIMQPYIFPYIGYFQLINAVDIFVLYDDVNFIKQGWINRNKILLNGHKYIFSIPIKNVSSFKRIDETEIAINEYEKWKKKFLRTIESSYKNAPFYSEIIKIIISVLNKKTNLISQLCYYSINYILEYLNIETLIYFSSKKYQDIINLKKEERIIEICKKENANIYINPIGGTNLYSKKKFKEKNIDLYFLKSKEIKYKQFNFKFVPWLSIIDVLMFNSKNAVRKMLDRYELI